MSQEEIDRLKKRIAELEEIDRLKTRLAELEGKRKSIPSAEYNVTPQFVANLNQYLERTNTPELEEASNRLKAQMGMTKTCAHCFGSGQVAWEGDCYFCGGSGKVPYDYKFPFSET